MTKNFQSQDLARRARCKQRTVMTRDVGFIQLEKKKRSFVLCLPTISRLFTPFSIHRLGGKRGISALWSLFSVSLDSWVPRTDVSDHHLCFCFVSPQSTSPPFLKRLDKSSFKQKSHKQLFCFLKLSCLIVVLLLEDIPCLLFLGLKSLSHLTDAPVSIFSRSEFEDFSKLNEIRGRASV